MKYLMPLISVLLLSNNTSAKDAIGDYWGDIESLCLKYSGATHPPCNRSNGAKMILGDFMDNCSKSPNKKLCTNDIVRLCTKYSGATHPPCNPSNRLDLIVSEVERAASGYSLDKNKNIVNEYWSDIEALCMSYSGATHPPCNRTNGAKMILDHVRQNCKGDSACLDKAVNLCIKYSPATHPPCNSQNGLSMVLEEIERVSKFYTTSKNDPGRELMLKGPCYSSTGEDLGPRRDDGSCPSPGAAK